MNSRCGMAMLITYLVYMRVLLEHVRRGEQVPVIATDRVVICWTRE